jgi:hypothetical protein
LKAYYNSEYYSGYSELQACKKCRNKFQTEFNNHKKVIEKLIDTSVDIVINKKKAHFLEKLTQVMESERC